MGTYWIAQRTLLSALKGKENPKKRGYMYCIADSLYCIVETNTML